MIRTGTGYTTGKRPRVRAKDDGGLRQECNLTPHFKATWHGLFGELYGPRCVILANGPSLPTSGELARIDCPVVGTNRSYQRRASDIHVVVDKPLTKQIGAHLYDLTPTAMLRLTNYVCPRCWTPRKIAWPKVEDEPPDKWFSTDLMRGWVVCCVSPCALQAAVWLGFREIIFCGLDLNTRRGERFYTGGLPLSVPLETQVKWFTGVKPLVDELGVRVINTCLDSGERVFDKVPFDEVFP